ncbi:MAG: L-ribulose-5-phosphate 4-epimerase AraD [Ignavibacteria bacterium]|nr:L-ribulose-5-phosphate 4-epimerase AraD [Ignavibacteria bacterium]
MLEQLKDEVCEANLRLVKEGLVLLTWGNASAVDRNERLIVIKPSGVPYSEMRPEHMVVVSLDTGEAIENGLTPSSDTPTHIELYSSFTEIGGIAHTHSLYATAWAQATREIPPLGTTHADQFHGPVPCTRQLRAKEIRHDYEKNTGKVIIERFKKMDPLALPGVLVAGHGPFTWGRSVGEAVETAIVLERVARMASETLMLNRTRTPLTRSLLDKHFLRKHGKSAYYGQKEHKKK